MRLWSLDPGYLDSKGLVALWRETLLAQKVLRGKTKGYKNHPQLDRFKACRFPVKMIGSYLSAIALEAERRGYQFDRSRIFDAPKTRSTIPVTRGQLAYEWQHLRSKLKTRDPERFRTMAASHKPKTHPLFSVLPGKVEAWERPAG